MRKIRFIAEEFFRSFQKSLIKNILLMLMFSISLVMAVIMCSYYVGLGEKYETITQKVDGREWYGLDVLTESGKVIPDNFTTVGRCRDMMDFYEALKTLKDAPVMSINTDQSLMLKEEDIAKLFREEEFRLFVEEDSYGRIAFGDGSVCMAKGVKGAQLDREAFLYFGLGVQEGEGFTEENTTVRRDGEPLPILLGSDYKGILDVGTILDVNYWLCAYHCRVVGILEPGTRLPMDGQMTQELVSMDDRIIFPHGIRLLEDADSVEQMKAYAWNDFLALQDGYAQTDGVHIRELVETYGRIADEYGYPPVQLVGTSLGLDLLRRESASSVKIMLVLTVVLVCFSFYGLFVTFYDKIQSNSKIYGIYLMNGCSLRMILVPCLLEIAVILFPAIVAARYVLVDGLGSVGSYFRAGPILQAAYVMIGAAYLTGASFLAYLMHGVDTERLIRRKD